MIDENRLESLKYFPRDKSGLFIVFELYTFDNMFRLLLKEGFDHEEVMNFMLAECSFSALVFQERIHNNKFLRLNEKDALSPEYAALKARLMSDILSIITKN
ncbi:MAG: hypothetical protein JRJ62_13940 [Deltaproteobacteria bacterium]|nr:hypothetical protein [Deltaproteobacteria bacterium]